MKLLIHLFLTIIAVDGLWRVEWTPHSANRALVIVTRCEGGKPFQAYNRYDITPESARTRVRQVYIPDDSTACWVGAEILRNDGDDPTQEYRAEWSMARVN